MSQSTSAGCPFFFGGPVPLELFIGRELEQIELYDAISKLGIRAIVGERGIGKSSLLHKIMHDYPSRKEISQDTRLVLIDLQDPHCHQQRSFLGHAMCGLLAHVRYGADDPVQPTPSALEDRLQREKMLGLVEFADAIEALGQTGLRPVLCIDEFERFTEHEDEFDEDFFDALRSLHNAGQIGCLLASRESMEALFDQQRPVSPFVRNVLTTHLGEFDNDDEARALLTQPSAQPFSEDEIRWLMELAGRHPARLQIAAGELCRAKERPPVNRREVARRYERSMPQWLHPSRPNVSLRALSQKTGTIITGVFKAVFIDLPKTVGRLTKFLGEEETWTWVRGMITLLVIIAILAGALSFDDLRAWFIEMTRP